ncbi:alpha-(1-_3)-arabinofuranosyltransferase domain-containing protein [Flexivirga caeni]|uniref:alpha-(1->3)-arabinofuranosyltransferase domain-containing protein n=1 Tax=Flexivirga caeni TaxID=2294115 RepID=UPI000F446E30|nr:alpha-(1->3)-arabinofuranosyltransferase family protein [Flexivirga caeni]
MGVAIAEHRRADGDDAELEPWEPTDVRRLMTGYRLTVLGLTVLLALIVGLNGLGHFFTDIKPEVYLAPGRMIRQYLSAWTDTPYLGSPNFNVGLVPVLLVTGALRGIGLSPEWTFKVFHFALWLATAWGTSRLTRRLLGDRPGGDDRRSTRWAGLAAGVLVLANPYTIQAGSTLAIALPMSLLPWSLLAFVNALRSAESAPRAGRLRRFAHAMRWPAVFGLEFFAMSGMNVAVVPIFQLLALLPVLFVALRVWRLGWPVVLATVGRCAVFVVGVSVYWLVPAFGALSTGNQIVDESETLTGIAKVSSFPEVLRGMGLWSLYGQDNHGAWVPQDAVYLTSPLVMVLTMLWPALALLAMRWLRGPVRVMVAGTVAIAAVVMVGIFPAAGHPASPFGIAFEWFVGLPGMAAFRTTNKVGALLALGFALALGVAVVKVGPRIMRRDGLAPIAAIAASLLVLAWILPAVTNRLYTSPMDIPGYWRQAAAAIDRGNPDSAVLFLPGQTRPAYRWTVDRPDDVANSLFNRQVIIPETSPNASAPGGNFLASLDSTLENGVVPDGTISTYARYLGADTVLMRHDTDWEDTGGVRPDVVSAIAAADKGLFGVANYGAPGEYVATSDSPADERALPPLQRYAVTDPTSSVRVESTKNSLVIAGDGFAVPELVSAGLLRQQPSFRYAQDLTTGQLAGDLGGGHTLVLTDTNARRDAITNRLANNQGPLLAANQPLGITRTLGTNPADQTVLERTGARVTATSEGGAFFDLPCAVPENAVDGDPNTSWLFGDFGRAPGNVLTITEPSAERLGTIRIAQAQVGAVTIAKVTVRAGGKAVTRSLPTTGYADFPMGDTTARRVTVTIDSTRGTGYNLVGISDIQLPGPPATRWARTPLTFDDLYDRLSAPERAAFDATPLDVLLTREQGTPNLYDDPQTQLRRVISLPDERTFDATAAVRVAGSFEPILDKVAGFSPRVRASSSDFYFRLSSTRASLAADGDPSTAWEPGGKMVGAWWQLDGPERTIRSVSVTQQPGDGNAHDPRDSYARRVTFTVDGRTVASATLKAVGTTKVAIPSVDGKPVRGKQIRMTIDSIDGTEAGVPPRFTEIDSGLQMRRLRLGPIQDAGVGDPRCTEVATVDGHPVRMRPATKQLAGTAAQGSTWALCGTLHLGAGTHRIEPVPGFILDDLHLLDTLRATPAQVAQPATRITDNGATHKTLHVTTTGPTAVILGQSIAPGWHATANGRDLGAAQLLDGYATGWLLPKAGTYTVQIRYAPQLRADIALAVSIVVLLLAVGLVVFAFVSRRRPGEDDGADGDGPAGYDDASDSPDDADPDPDNGAGPETAAQSAFGLRDTWGRAQPRSDAVWRRAAHRAGQLLRTRPALELALVVVAGFFVGWGGLAAGVLVVVALRLRRAMPAWWLQVAGAVLLLVSMGVYLLVLGDARGTLSADGVAQSLWPHWLAGAGLVVGLVGVLRERRGEERMSGND